MNKATAEHTTNHVETNRPLPKGWRWVNLAALCELVNGDAYKPSDWNRTGIPIIRIQNLNDASKPFNYWSGSLHDRVLIKNGDVLLAWSGTPGTSFGTHLWTRGTGVLNQHIFRVDFKTNSINPEWFVCAVNYQLDVLIIKAHGGVGLRHVKKGEVESLEIPLPPLPEQRRIAAILNEQMTAVDKARKSTEQQLEAAKALPAAYLRSVFNSPEAQKWPIKKLEDICRDISDGTHFTPTYVENGVPFLSVKNIKERILFENCRYITGEQHQVLCRRCKPEKGDVLYTKVGTTGIAKAIDINREFSIFVSVALLKLKSEVFPYYLEKVLNSPLCKIQAENLTQGMANRNLVLQDLKKIELPLPPLVEQKKIASTLNERMTPVGILNKSLTEQLDTINKLPGALLKRAFEGEL